MDLKEIGLTENEAKVYETLLRLGKTGAAHISKESRVPYGRIYTVLGSLEEKGLVRMIPERSKKYTPSAPKELEKYIAKRRAELDAAAERIKRYKALYESHEEENVQIVKGERNFKQLVLGMDKAKKYDYSVKLAFRRDPEFIRDMRRRKNQGVKSLSLGPRTKETQNDFDFWKKLQKDVKEMPNEGVAMTIKDGKEMLLVLAHSNTIMKVTDKPFIKFMERLFLSYYETH